MTQSLLHSNATNTINPIAVAFKKIRIELLGIDRKVAAILLNCSHKTIERYENGRGNFTQEKIDQWLRGYRVSRNELKDILAGKIEKVTNKRSTKNIRTKVIEHNKFRRSYKKIIDKRISTLACMSKLVKPHLSQENASLRCGYTKCTIGHIENGRIEIDNERIEHIVNCYGFTLEEYKRQLQSDKFISDILDECIAIIKQLPEEKLLAVHPLLKSFS